MPYTAPLDTIDLVMAASASYEKIYQLDNLRYLANGRPGQFICYTGSADITILNPAWQAFDTTNLRLKVVAGVTNARICLFATFCVVGASAGGAYDFSIDGNLNWRVGAGSNGLGVIAGTGPMYIQGEAFGLAPGPHTFDLVGYSISATQSVKNNGYPICMLVSEY